MIPLWLIVLCAASGGLVLGFAFGLVSAAYAQAQIEIKRRERAVKLLGKIADDPNMPPAARTDMREFLEMIKGGGGEKID